MTRKTVKEENRVQVEAFRRLNGDELELISQYAADFRRIIMDFESTHDGQIPSADDLLWIESEFMGRDITRE